MTDPGGDLSHLLNPARRADHDVAAAADAWLNDPRDHEAYRRLVAAVLRRRDHLNPTLPGITSTGPRDAYDAARAAVDLDEVLDHNDTVDRTDLPDPEPVGTALGGPLEQVIARLRGLADPDQEASRPE